MRAMATVLVLTLAAGTAWAQEADLFAPSGGGSDCSGFGEGPAINVCFSQGFAYGGGERGALATIACVVDRLNEWKLNQLRCLQNAMAARQATVLWPWRALGAIKAGLRSVDTLREEVERLACDWRFTPRTALFRDLYRRPVKLCRDSFHALWGSHEDFYDADRQELLDWSSTLTHNMIEDRTIHDHGGAGEVPEETWRRIAMAAEQSLGSSGNSPGEAARLGAELQADRLRVDANTMEMAAQTILVQQQARDLKALKRRRDRALARHFLGLLTEVDSRVPPAPEFSAGLK